MPQVKSPEGLVVVGFVSAAGDELASRIATMTSPGHPFYFRSNVKVDVSLHSSECQFSSLLLLPRSLLALRYLVVNLNGSNRTVLAGPVYAVTIFSLTYCVKPY